MLWGPFKLWEVHFQSILGAIACSGTHVNAAPCQRNANHSVLIKTTVILLFLPFCSIERALLPDKTWKWSPSLPRLGR